MKNKEQKSEKKPLILVGLFGALIGFGICAMISLAWLGADGIAYIQASNIIKNSFVGDYDWTEVKNTTMDAMVEALDDRWSYYLDEDDYARVVANRSNHYVGIGVTVSYTDAGEIIVLQVEKNGPAATAGILPYDIISSVDGILVTDENKEDMVDMLGGEEGTEVVLTVETGEEESRELILVRSDIAVESVSAQMLEDDIAYVRIENFYSDSGTQFCEAVDTLLAEGAVGFVFDLRQNPGGYVTEMTEMLDKLLPEGDIFIQRDVNDNETVYSSDEDFIDLPFVVLLDANSYSAAEFFAAALREAVDATILGETTSGKGYAQALYPLYDGTAVGISTSRYYTGEGVSLIGTGVVPDEFISLEMEKLVLFASGILDVTEDDVVSLALSYFK